MSEIKERPDLKEEKPLANEEIEEKKDERKVPNKWINIKDNITVEPLLAGLIIPSVISRFAMGNFNLDKACRVSFKFDDVICDALVKRTSNNYSSYEKEIQKLISSIDIWKGIISTALPCIIIMFLGAWSDRTGKRKICILLPILGEFLTSVNNIVNVYFFYEIPIEVTVFSETFFPAITGGWVTMFLGVFSFISDITSEETRTFRVGVVNFCMTCGLPIGIGISGVLVQKMGYYGIFTMTAILFFLVLMYGIFYLQETDDWLRKKGLPIVQREDNDGKVTFFKASHIIETVQVAYRPRPASRRLKVLFTLLVTFIIFGPSQSEYHLTYLFARNRLNWDMIKFSVYTSYSIVLHSVGAMFSITILSKKLQIDDYLLCLVSIVSKFIGSIWTAFVQTDIEMYLVPLVEVLNGTTFTSLRSIISKLVEKDETARVNSLFSLTETMASLAFNPFYSWMYMKTLNEMAGAVYLCSAALIIPAAVILTFFYVQHRKELRNARKTALEAENKKQSENKTESENKCVLSSPVEMKAPEEIEIKNTKL